MTEYEIPLQRFKPGIKWLPFPTGSSIAFSGAEQESGKYFLRKSPWVGNHPQGLFTLSYIFLLFKLIALIRVSGFVIILLPLICVTGISLSLLYPAF